MNLIFSIFSNTFVAFLILISIVVVAHELGHFLVGRLLGIGVEEFAIGFGPRIFSFKIGGTDYRVNWFLLGGYVRFYGADTEQQISPQDRERSILHAKLYKRMCVSFAGPFANFILSLVIMMGLYSFGVTKQPPVFRVLNHSAAYDDGLRSGDKALSIDGKEVADWSVLMQRVSASPDKPLNIKVERSGVPKNFVLIPKAEVVTASDGENRTVGRAGITPFFSEPVIVPWEHQFFSQIGLGGRDKIISVNGKEVKYLDQALAEIEDLTKSQDDAMLAAKVLNRDAALKSFDIVVLREGITQTIAVNFTTKKMSDWARAVLEHPSLLEHQSWADTTASSELTIAGFENQTSAKKGDAAAQSLMECGLKSGDTIRRIDDSPLFSSQVSLYSWLDTETNRINKNVSQFKNNSISANIMATDANGAQKAYSCFLPIRNARNELNKEKLFIDLPIKFAGTPVLYPSVKIQAKNVFDSIKFGFSSVLNQTTFIYTGFEKLFSGHVPLSSLGGPIAIAGFAGDAAKAGIETFLIAMSLMSINIGIFNLLPLPVLDGGALLLQFVELIYRKPIPKNIQLLIARFGIVFLLTMFIFVFYNDITRLFHH